MSDQPDVLVVGAGFAGMYAVHRFRELGLTVKALEAGSDVGGTWYWNRYPGARCDVPSLEYSYGFSPELEQEWDWPEVFSAQDDILRYANHVANKFDLRRDMQFNTRIAKVEWQDDTRRWRLTSEAGETFEAPFCVMATGCLSVPVEPKIPGAERFRGEVYHTGRWPHESVDLTGKRVGVIGTGSSGVQAIPELARQSAHLTVFQRTPVYTVPANRKRMREAVQQEFRDNYRQIREMQQKNAGGVSNFRPRKSVQRGDSVPADVTRPSDITHTERSRRSESAARPDAGTTRAGDGPLRSRCVARLSRRVHQQKPTKSPTRCIATPCAAWFAIPKPPSICCRRRTGSAANARCSIATTTTRSIATTSRWSISARRRSRRSPNPAFAPAPHTTSSTC